jgi:hypothetical protein
MSKKNLTASLTDRAGYELLVNFDFEVSVDIDPKTHPDDPLPNRLTYYENPEINSIELVIHGIGIDVTEQVKQKVTGNKMTKFLNDLLEYAEDNYEQAVDADENESDYNE